jgi:hypothetical protein
MGGRYYLKGSSDHFYREMHVLTSEGLETILVHGSRESKLVREYKKAFDRYKEIGDRSVFDKFKNKKVGAGARLLTEVDLINGLIDSGELEYESVYRGNKNAAAAY